MSDVVYKVEFDVNQITNENEEITESVSRSPKPKTMPSKKGFYNGESPPRADYVCVGCL